MMTCIQDTAVGGHVINIPQNCSASLVRGSLDNRHARKNYLFIYLPAAAQIDCILSNRMQITFSGPVSRDARSQMWVIVSITDITCWAKV